jgi:hypothetical protein
MPSFNVYLDTWTERRGLKPGEVGFGREDRMRKIKHPYEILYQSGPIVIIRHTGGTEKTTTAPDQD